MTREWIADRLEANGIPYGQELPDRLLIYLRLLQEWNGKMDLTAVREEAEQLDAHMIDSLTVLKTGWIPSHASLIDVGTGAGFPGMVLAMACPGLQVTLLDSLRKRLDFLQTVARETGLNNVSFLHSRAEDGAGLPKIRESFDLATARAVAPLNVLCEYLLPYIRVGGRAMCWKGPALQQEMEAGLRAAKILGGRMLEPVSCAVAGQDWRHLILPILKERETPGQYPRKAGTPKAKPLGAVSR